MINFTNAEISVIKRIVNSVDSVVFFLTLKKYLDIEIR